MIEELAQLDRLFGPRRLWYVQGGDGKHVTEHRGFTTIAQVSDWMERNTHAASYYQVQVGTKETETRPSFDDIEQLVAFPIDIDPMTETRPATEKERTPCFEVAAKIADAFEQRGLGRPVRGDSGNGAQLFLRLRVDVTEPKRKVYWYDLFRRVQEWVKKEFADPRVQIDSVADFARIMALPGSMKRKVIGVEGPSEERPFRKVEFLDEGQATDAEKFEAFAAGLPMVETSANEDRQFKLVELNQEILDGLPPKVVALAQSWDEPGTDQSETAFGIAAELYAQGWNLDIIYTILYELYAKHPKESKRSRASELAGRALRAAMIPSNERIREAYLHAPKRKESKSAAMTIFAPKERIDDKPNGVIKVRVEELPLPPGIPTNTLGPLKESYPLTDVGNGERMLERWGKFLRSTPDKGWVVFRENKYVQDHKQAEVGKLASVSARLIPIHETLNLNDDKERMKVARHAEASEATSRINAAVTEFGRRVPASIVDFDRNPSLFNVTNGTLVIEGDKVYRKEHDPDDLITKVAGTYYDPNARAPKWEAFLLKNIPREDVREWLRRYCGSMLFGKNSDKAFAIVHGKKDTGKTTFKEVILAVLGDYASVTKWKTFEDVNEDMAQRELARIRGMRAIFAAESKKNMVLNVELLKELTGMDTTTAREIYQITFQYKPTFKLMLIGNHLPKITDEDDAIWGRVQVVPFEVVIPKSEQIKGFQDELLKEAPGILNWMIGGLKEWLTHGLPPSSRIEQATEEYRNDEIPVLDFVKARCELLDGVETASAILKLEYNTWASENGRSVVGKDKYDLSETRFGLILKGLKGVSKRTSGIVYYQGIRIKPKETLQDSKNLPHGEKRGKVDSLEGYNQNSSIDSSRKILLEKPSKTLQPSELPVGQQLTLEQAEPALKESVDATIAVQTKVAEAKGESEKYEAAGGSASGGYNIAAFDLETVNLDFSDPDNRILTIGFAGSDGFSESWAFDDERETIKAFVQKANEYTCLLGWNTDKFDLPMLRARVEGWDDSVIPPVLDALRAHKQLLRKGETKMQLDYIAKKHLGKGKLEFDPTRTKQYFDDPAGREKLREYNKRDAQLVLDLNAVMGYFDTFEAIVDEASFDNVDDGASQWMRSKDGLRREFAAMSKNKADNGFVWWRPIMGLIEHYCQKNSLSNPFDWPSDSMKEERKVLLKDEEQRPGGFVMHPVKGHHENVIEFDFRSLYPSLIMSFNVGPETWMPPGNGDIKAPFGTYYSRVESIISGTLKGLLVERNRVKADLAAAKSRGAGKEEQAAFKGKSEAMKILMNSFYGQFYAGFSPLFHFDSARNITTLGQECVKLMLAVMKEYGAEAIAGDTDSTYIKVPRENFNEAFATDLSAKLTARIAAHLKEKYNVDFTGSFDFKGLYDHMEIWKMKRYAKLESGKPITEMDVIGYERGDVFDLQLALQKKVFECNFTGRSVQGMLEAEHTRFKAERDHTQVLRWRRGHTSAEGRALHFLMEHNLPPIPGDSVGFLILGRGTKKDPEHRIAARRLDGETIEWADEKDGVLLRGPSREKTFLTAAEEDVLWTTIVENLDGVK